MRTPSLLTLVLGLGLLVAAPAGAACDPAGSDAADVGAARAAVAASCDCAAASDRPAFVRCARETATSALVNRGCLLHVVRCARMSTCGLPGSVACCRTAASGTTKGVILSDASRCVAPSGGSAWC